LLADGTYAERGRFTFNVSATNTDGHNVPLEEMNNGIVTGITYDGGMPFLIVNGAHVNLRDIISINRAQIVED
jgi:hypothetical protein